MKLHFGIDYGAKKAGTTAICMNLNNGLEIITSEKNRDTDTFIKEQIQKFSVTKVYIDAPLSLPGAYSNINNEFHHRVCDRALKAMSPMFLGGLTARAMQLKAQLSKVEFHETYPGGFVREVLKNNEFYKKRAKDPMPFFHSIKELFPIEIHHQPKNMHEMDAMLCWLSGYRHSQKKHAVFGDEAEGVIIL